MSRQMLSKARMRLKECGLIDFEIGNGNITAASYTFLFMSTNSIQNLTDNLTNQLTIIKSNKIKDKSNLTSSNVEVLSLNELQRILLSDVNWQNSVMTYLSDKEAAQNDEIDLLKQIESFFTYLKASGTEGKGLSDCKCYFLNWLNKRIRKVNRKPIVCKKEQIGVILKDNSHDKFKDISGW